MYYSLPQKENREREIAINQKLIKNLKQDSRRSAWSLAISMACLCALLTHNQLARKIGCLGAATTAVVNTGAMIALSKNRKKLKQEMSLLKQQERSFA